MAPGGTANPQRWAELATPSERPSWDCNTEEGMGHLERYQAAILQSVKRGAQKPMSTAKPSEVIQRESESPSEFYERLCEAYRRHMPIDPEAAGSQIVINEAFVSQAYPKNVRWGDTKGFMNFYTSLNAQYLCWEETCYLNWRGTSDLPPPSETSTLRGGSTTYLLSLSVAPRDEWRLHNLPEGKPDWLNS